jgi:hypothetical protein
MSIKYTLFLSASCVLALHATFNIEPRCWVSKKLFLENHSLLFTTLLFYPGMVTHQHAALNRRHGFVATIPGEFLIILHSSFLPLLHLITLHIISFHQGFSSILPPSLRSSTGRYTSAYSSLSTNNEEVLSESSKILSLSNAGERVQKLPFRKGLIALHFPLSSLTFRFWQTSLSEATWWLSYISRWLDHQSFLYCFLPLPWICIHILLYFVCRLARVNRLMLCFLTLTCKIPIDWGLLICSESFTWQDKLRRIVNLSDLLFFWKSVKDSKGL